MTVVIPTLAADPSLRECLASLLKQSFRRFVAVVVDNSGCGAAVDYLPGDERIRCVRNESNTGFGAAINAGFLAYPSEFLAVLNDDAIAHECWLDALVEALDRDARIGMAASLILQAGTNRLDSAGLGIARDGSSKQIARGALQDAHRTPGPALIPSGCAAIYRRKMLDEIGLFEGGFFLYCEDTDLALRGHWSGWGAAYVASAVVEHRYSMSAGRASSLKAYLVERNRLRVAVRCLPLGWLAVAPLASLVRYVWHLVFMLRGKGKASDFAQRGAAWQLPWIVVKAHLALLRDLPELLKQRKEIARRVSSRDYAARLRRHLIPLREVAAQ